MQRRLLLLLPPHLPTEFIQRLDMPEAFAGDGAKGQGFEQMQRRGFADVADAEELLLVHYLGSAVPVDGKYIHRKYLSDYDSLILSDRGFTVNVPAVAKEWSSVITRGTVLKSTIDPPANTGCSILIFPLVDTCTDLKCQRRFGIRKNVSAF